MNTKKVIKEYVFCYIKELITLNDFQDIDYFFTTYFLNMPCVNTDDEARTLMKYESIDDIKETLYMDANFLTNINDIHDIKDIKDINKEIINKYWKVLGREAINNEIFMDYLYKNKRGILNEYVLNHVIKKIISRNKMDIENLFNTMKM
jgi:hypothetical protein